MTSTATRTLAPVDLVSERSFLGPALEEALVRVLHSGQYVLGPEVTALEEAFAKRCRAAQGIGVASGTDALVLALLGAGVKPGDHVVTSPFTFFASAGAIAWVGAKPVLCDVEPDTALLDLEQARAALTPETTCVLPVHLYGQLADVVGYRALCDERGLLLVEDAAQAHGAERDGRAAGELGDACTFSFYPTKNLGAAGEGGLVVAREEETANRIRQYRDHGSPAKYRHAFVGTNSRLHAMQAALLNVKLPHLDAWNERRRALAARYDAGFADCAGVKPIVARETSLHVYHQYTIRVHGEGRRDAVLEGLKERGIFAAVHYPLPVHLQEAAAGWGYGPGDFPVAEALSLEVLCLPVHPFLEDADVDRVIEEVRRLADG